MRANDDQLAQHQSRLWMRKIAVPFQTPVAFFDLSRCSDSYLFLKLNNQRSALIRSTQPIHDILLLQLLKAVIYLRLGHDGPGVMFTKWKV